MRPYLPCLCSSLGRPGDIRFFIYSQSRLFRRVTMADHSPCTRGDRLFRFHPRTPILPDAQFPVVEPNRLSSFAMDLRQNIPRSIAGWHFRLGGIVYRLMGGARIGTTSQSRPSRGDWAGWRRLASTRTVVRARRTPQSQAND